MFAWVIGKTGGNTRYECGVCGERLTGQPAHMGSHFDAEWSTQRVALCSQKLPDLLREQIKTIINARKEKKQKADKKRVWKNMMSQPAINDALSAK